MQKKIGRHQLRFRDKARGKLNYPDFEKLAHVIQHGLQGFTAKNIEGGSTAVNDLSHIL